MVETAPEYWHDKHFSLSVNEDYTPRPIAPSSGPAPRPLVKWYGGKSRMAKVIAAKMPAHRFYVEPFGGAAGVLMSKTPCYVEVYNDLHSGIVNLFRVVRNPATCQALIELLEMTPYSREEWRECNYGWEAETDPVEKARKVFVTLAQNFVGATAGGSWNLSGLNGKGNAAGYFYGSLPNIKTVMRRFQNVQIEQKAALEVMEAFDGPDTLIYADPPYLPETRSDGKANNYKHEMTVEDHEKLLAWLLTAKSKIILSGYPSPLYTTTLERAGWIREDHEAVASSALRSRRNGLKDAPPEKFKRTECLWFSPNVEQSRGLFAGLE
jgi:DNA adenine methylase